MISTGESETSILGLDLGQSGDYAAAANVRLRRSGPEFVGPPYPKLRCTSLRRWPLGTDYCDVVSDALDLNTDVIVVDFTGVGRPVVDVMRREAMRRNYRGRIRPVTIAASVAQTRMKTEQRGTHWVVPKIDLVTSIVLWQQRKMLVLPRVPETDNLIKEMKDFRMKYTKAANLQFTAVPSAHDDLVIAFGLACWWASRFGTRTLQVVC